MTTSIKLIAYRDSSINRVVFVIPESDQHAYVVAHPEIYERITVCDKDMDFEDFFEDEK